MAFTDQKQRVATEEHVKARWGGVPNGERFRCYLCGHKFHVGDKWRWVCTNKYINFMVCDACDSPDVIEKWTNANKEIEARFWWAIPDCSDCQRH